MRFVRKLLPKGRGSQHTDKTTVTAVLRGALSTSSFPFVTKPAQVPFHERNYFDKKNKNREILRPTLSSFPALTFSLSVQHLSTRTFFRCLHLATHTLSTCATGGVIGIGCRVKKEDNYRLKLTPINSISAIIPPTTPAAGKKMAAMPAIPIANDEALLSSCRAFIPSLTNAMHKGQAGRIGVLGGSEEYTGAPYFAAISSLKVGADLSHVFCARSAATVIKAYSPELIVHPLLDTENAVESIMEWVPRIHTFVIGCGLGRDPKILTTVSCLIERLKEADKLLVIDADGLYLITEQPDLVKGYSKVILTPNSVEFARLCAAVLGEEVKPAPSASAEKVRELAMAFGHVTILHKGATDVVSNGRLTVCCAGGGSNRRCGGQGDLLAGSLAVLFHWASSFGDRAAAAAPPELLAVYAACRLTRECSRLAYSQHGRSTTTTDLIRLIHQSFSFLFGP